MTISPELPKTYDPQPVEARWWKAWWDQKIFEPQADSKNNFSIVIPPPNVTGSLHMGHALNNTLQDILIRFHRMEGDASLWVFGMDHAGIATQNVVERQLKSEGRSRYDLGRDEFVRRVWDWKEESGGTIRNQLKKLGASLDYQHERFTMDAGLSKAVKEVFVRLYEDQKIYRAQRLINWCPRCLTALSDLEVEHEEIRSHLWHIRYPLEADPQNFIVVATTRPETLLGDTAVAVHPDDERYQAFIGKNVELPILGRLIPIVADASVDSQFGSGAVKITPAHDFNDFETGNRHNLERINLFTPEARMNENAGHFTGLDRFECRKKIEKELQELDLLDHVEDYKTSVGHCYRCKTVVEPYLSMQWFVRTKELANAALQAVRDGQTRIIPEQWQNTYFAWMENIQDWCVSRQIWWGHRIPAWYCGRCAETGGAAAGIIVSREENMSQCPHCGHNDLVAETDVLDTWFSSALWPFATLGWPEKTPELARFYPTSVLITGFDILFFWVARMMMMGLYCTGQVPFRDVYIHALVRDAEGQKMSKSKGNVIDPLEIMEKHGTDAFRFTLAALAPQGRDVKLSEDRVLGFRNFCNKIWNAARFMLESAKPHADLSLLEKADFNLEKSVQAITPQHPINQWLLSQLSECISSVRGKLGDYKFNEAAMEVYHFFWGTYCDWFLELSKNSLKAEEASLDEVGKNLRREFSTVAILVLDQALRLLHPFMPFVTEELWHALSTRSQLLAISAFPQALSESTLKKFHGAQEQLQATQAIVDKVRQIRMEAGVPLGAYVNRVAIYSSENLEDSIFHYISNLAKISQLNLNDPILKNEKGVARGATGYKDVMVLVDLKGLVDLEKERARQQKELQKLQNGLVGTEKKLANVEFMAKAPPELRSEEEQKLKDYRMKIAEVEAGLKML